MKNSFEARVVKSHGIIGVTADILLCAMRNGAVHVLLIRRRNEPFRDRWAIPGGFLDKGETLEEAARRELREETEIEGGFSLEQCATFSDPERDPRGRVISTAFFALVPEQCMQKARAGSDAKELCWFPATELPKPLAFDHEKILSFALDSLRMAHKRSRYERRKNKPRA